MFSSSKASTHHIGNFDRRVTLYEVDESGRSVVNTMELTKVKLRDVWAQHIPVGQGEVFDEKIRTRDDHHYVTHWDPDVASRQPETLAVEDGDRLYFCYGLEELVRGKFILLKCEYNDGDTTV